MKLLKKFAKFAREHAAKFNYDISAICADIRRQQKESGREIVSPQTNIDEKIEGEINLLKVA